jgi:hypothetical protein
MPAQTGEIEKLALTETFHEELAPFRESTRQKV